MKKIFSSFVIFIIAAGVFTSGTVVGAARIYPFNRIAHFVQQKLGIYNPQTDPLYSEMTLLFAQEKPEKTVMLGDSLTEFNNWPGLLGHPDIANRGIAGDTSFGVLKRLNLSVKSAKVVFLMIGVNDPGRFISEADTKNNIEKIVDQLSKTSKVIVQSTLLTRKSDLNGFVTRIDGFEKTLCDSGKCTYVDLNAVLSRDGMLKKEFSIDGIHINAAAYTAWGSVIKPIFEQEMASSL